MKTISIRNKNIHGDKFSVTVDVKDGKREVLSKVIEARSKNELDNTLANILTLAEQVEADFEKVTEGEWTPPDKVEKTAEEIKQININNKELELLTEVERAKREKGIAKLAKTDIDVATKLAELEALKK